MKMLRFNQVPLTAVAADCIGHVFCDAVKSEFLINAGETEHHRNDLFF